MIDAITSPGMAVDIRLSTQEPVQQLGARLAQILSGELSRMRADIAFASATGIAVHSAVGDTDTLRAQQSTLLGHHNISLTTQTAMHTESALRSSIEQANLHGQDESERDQWLNNEGNAQHQCASQDHSEDDNEDDPDADLVRALQDALAQFYVITLESGITGVPIAVVLPADYFLEHNAPASLRYANQGAEENKLANLLVLCLGFDGDLAQEQTVWGFVYQNAECVGSAQGRWSTNAPIASHDQWVVKVRDPENPVSALTCQLEGWSNTGEHQSGLRICIDDHVALCSVWSWQMTSWTWL